MPRGGWSFENCFAWEETNDLPGYLGEGEVCLGDFVIHKINFI